MKTILKWHYICLLLSLAVVVSCKADSFYEVTSSVPAAGEQRIPKIIHHIWQAWNNGNPPPARYLEIAQELQQNHPNWEYKFWDIDKSKEFLKNNYPWFLPTYEGYDVNTKRVDSMRYFLLHHFGGLYLDMSFQNLKNLEPLLSSTDIVVAEQGIHDINNAFMASIPGHPFWLQIFSTLELKKAHHVLEATGPKMLTASVDSYVKQNGQKDLRVLDLKFIYPFDGTAAKEQYGPRECLKYPSTCKDIFPEAFMIKYWGASWMIEY